MNGYCSRHDFTLEFGATCPACADEWRETEQPIQRRELPENEALRLEIRNYRTMLDQIIKCCGAGFSRRQVSRMAREALEGGAR